MRNFPPQDERQLQAATGWLELGNWREANEEIENISPLLRGHPDVLKLRIMICAEAGKWDYVVDLGDSLSRLEPDSTFGPLQAAFGRQELGRCAEARERLIAIFGRFSEDWEMAYAIARVSCQLGERETTRQWFEIAFYNAGPLDIKKQALEDPDFKACWTDIAEVC